MSRRMHDKKGIEDIAGSGSGSVPEVIEKLSEVIDVVESKVEFGGDVEVDGDIIVNDPENIKDKDGNGLIKKYYRHQLTITAHNPSGSGAPYDNTTFSLNFVSSSNTPITIDTILPLIETIFVGRCFIPNYGRFPYGFAINGQTDEQGDYKLITLVTIDGSQDIQYIIDSVTDNPIEI